MFIKTLLLLLPTLTNASSGPQGGGSLVAMAGDGCVVVAHDRRASSALMGGQPLIGTSAQRVLRVNQYLLLGLSGLDGDVATFSEDMAATLRLRRIVNEDYGDTVTVGRVDEKSGNCVFSAAPEIISANALATLVSRRLYEHRTSPLFVEPVVAGLLRINVANAMAPPPIASPSGHRSSLRPGDSLLWESSPVSPVPMDEAAELPVSSSSSSSSSSHLFSDDLGADADVLFSTGKAGNDEPVEGITNEKVAPSATKPTASLSSCAQEKLVPYLCSQDSLGAQMVTDTFVVASASCSPSLYGCCEAMYEPNLPPDRLWRTAAKCLLAAMERDCLSGGGAVVHVITKDGISTHELKCPSD